MSLISKIQSLISSANAVTGESRTDLTSAVQDLKDGYGGSTVEKGLVFSEYDSDGYPHKAEFVGSWTNIPTNYLRGQNPGNGSLLAKISLIDIPEGVTELKTYSCYSCNIPNMTFPSTLTSMGEQALGGCGLLSADFPNGVHILEKSVLNGSTSIREIIFRGNITEIRQQALRRLNSLMLADFSNNTTIPSLYSVESFGTANGCVIKIPLALSDQTLGTGNGWESQTNWSGLTNIVWEAV